MAKYEVPMEMTVTGYVTVEADTREDAIEEAYQQGLPGLMHLDPTYPDEGEWEVPQWYVKGEEND